MDFSVHDIFPELKNSPFDVSLLHDEALANALHICFSNHAPMLLIWGEKHLHFFNDAMLSHLPPDFRQTQGKPARELWKDKYPAAASVFNEVMRNGTPLRRRNTRCPLPVKEDLKEHLWTCSYIPVRDHKGNTRGVLISVSSHPANSRNKSEDVIYQVSERFRMASTAAKIGAYTRDFKEGKDFWSPEFKTIFGYDPGKELPIEDGMPANIHPDDREAVRKEMQARKQRKIDPVFSSEHRIIHSDGTIHWVLIRGLMEFDDSGNPQGSIGIAMDITERKEIELKLQQNQQFLEAVLDQMPAGVSIAEAPTGKLLLHNKEAVRILRHPMLASETYEGYAQYGALHNDLTPYAPEEYPIARSLNGAVVDQEEMIYRRGDGTLTTFLVSAAPVYDHKGRMMFAVSTFYDISEIKKIHQDLLKAKKEADKAAKVKEEFLSHMSHEIRTPLHSVIGLSHLLLNKDPRFDQLDNLKALHFSAQNLLYLINDILDFSKIEAGKAEIQENEINLHELLKSLRQSYSAYASENNNTLHLQIADNIPSHIVTDRLKLSQVLNNLLSNAVKFTQNGQINIHVKMVKETNKNYLLKFMVEDTGIGIDEDKLELIFEKFTQVHSGNQFEGTGLGLTITSMLLKLMNSSIHVESEKAKGSRFWFNLPAGKTKYKHEEVIKNNLDKKTNYHPIKILLAEDVDVNRMLIEQLLHEWWNILPDIAVNGKEAVQKVTNNKYDLILMDLRMPVMDGYEATKRIREIKDHQTTPIIAFTANTEVDLKIQRYAVLFDGIITKPIEPFELKQSVIKYMNNRSNRTEEISLNTMQKYIGKDPAKAKLMLEKALLSLQIYREEYTEAIRMQDIDKLSDVKHKAQTMLHLLQLNDVKELFARSKELLKNNTLSEREISRWIEEGEMLFNSKIGEIKKQISML